jgi:Putative citrate transport
LKRTLVTLLLLVPALAQAAEVDGSALAAWWAIPFAGMLLSIAIMPLAALCIWPTRWWPSTSRSSRC